MPRKPKKISDKPSENNFLNALKFVGSILRGIGPPVETHILLSNKWAVAFNGIISAGHVIEEDLYACPQAKLMIEALSKCTDQLSITQLDINKLSIKSGKFKAIVPCIDPTLLTISAPDAPIAAIDDRFKVAIEAVGVLSSDTAHSVYGTSILINGKSVVSTLNGTVIFEYWHGIDLPPAEYSLAIPKALVEPLTKSNKKLKSFGFSDNSITFYFEDNSFLKSQQYSDKWPEVSHILNQLSNPFPVPAGLWEGLAAIAPFSETGMCWFQTGSLHSHAETGVGASFEAAGLPKAGPFVIKQLRLLQGHAEAIDFLAPGPNGSHSVVFFGKSIRGLIAGRTQ